MVKMLEKLFSSLGFFECKGSSLEFYLTVGNATLTTMFYANEIALPG